MPAVRNVIVIDVKTQTKAASKELRSLNKDMAELSLFGTRSSKELVGLQRELANLQDSLRSTSKDARKLGSPEAIENFRLELEKLRDLQTRIGDVSGFVAIEKAVDKLQKPIEAGPVTFDVSGAVRSLEQLSKKSTVAVRKLAQIDAITTPWADMAMTIDGATAGLELFGQAGEDVAKTIRDISDPNKRLNLGLELSKKAAEDGGLSFTKLRDILAEFRARAEFAVGGADNLEMIMGAATVTAGLFAAGLLALAAAAFKAGEAVGTFLVDSIKEFIKTDAEATNAQKQFDKETKKLLHTMGNAITGGRGMVVVFEGLTSIIKDATAWIDKNRVAIFNLTRAAVQMSIDIAERVAGTIAGFRVIVHGFFDTIVAASRSITSIITKIAAGWLFIIQKTFDALPSVVKDRLGFVNDQLKSAEAKLQGVFAQTQVPEFMNLKEAVSDARALSGTFDTARANVNAFGLAFDKATKRKTVKQLEKDMEDAAQNIGEGADKMADRFKNAKRAADALAKTIRSAFSAASDAARKALADVRAIEEGPRALQQRIKALTDESRILEAQLATTVAQLNPDHPMVVAARQNLDDIRSRVGRLSAELAKQNAARSPFTELIKDGKIFKDLLQGIGATAIEGFGALFAGGTNAKSFFGSILGSLGDLASNMGQFLLLSGTGLSALFPGAVNPGAIAAGVGLIALGGALKAVSASSSGGSGGTTGGGGGDFSAASFVRQFSNDNNRDEDRLVVVKMDIDGRRFVDAVAEPLNDGIRRNQIRSMG